MKKYKIILSALSTILFISPVFADDPCFPKISHTVKRGLQCSDPSSISVSFVNQCNEVRELKVCFIKVSGKKDCINNGHVKPHSDAGAGFWSCKATGEYVWQSRKAGDKTKFTIP